MAAHGASPEKFPLRDMAVERIRKDIITGRLSPGEPLVESRLAEELGVSRVPVREALQRLSEQGFVELRPGHSARVAQRSARDIIEMFEVRGVIEGLVCALAATRRTDDDVVLLKDCVREGHDAVSRKDWAKVARGNGEFHGRLAAMAGNAHLVEVVRGYHNRLAWLSDASAEQRDVAAWGEHAEVVDAIAAQDAHAAERLGRLHVETTKDAFVQAFLDGTLSL